MPSIPLIIDTSFAENVNSKGNRCGLTFQPPLQVPRDAQPRLRLYSSSFAYNFPNVSSDFQNDKLVIKRMDSSNVMTHQHIVTFATGLYGSLDDIARVIKHSMHTDTNFPNIEINFIGVAATQKVHVEVINGNSDVLRLSFATAGSIGSVMGFTNDKNFAANSTTSHESDTTASLDRTTSVLVQTSLCNGSVVSGNGGQSTLAMIHLADFVPASVVSFTPNNMLEVPATSLAGAAITTATFALINQNGEDLDTLQEKWQLVIEIVW